MILKRSWYFLKQQNGLKYFPGATETKSVKTKCKFYNYETRTPIPSEEVFDKYLIPFITGNMLTDEHIKVNTNRGNGGIGVNTGSAGIHLKDILNDDLRIMTDNTGGQPATSNSGKCGIKLEQILNEDVRLVSEDACGNAVAANTGNSRCKT